MLTKLLRQFFVAFVLVLMLTNSALAQNDKKLTFDKLNDYVY